MRCLSIHQPWASLIALGPKRIENRTWATSYRGPLLIHASQMRGRLDAARRLWRAHSTLWCPDPFPGGAIVAVADLVHCVELAGAEHLQDCRFAEGPWCWMLAGVEPLRAPLALRGHQRLFNVDDDTAAEALSRTAYGDLETLLVKTGRKPREAS